MVVHCAPTPDDMIFAGELRKLASEGRIRLIEKHTETDGRLRSAGPAKWSSDLSERQTWACGPTGMLDALEQHWSENGKAERLHTERFRATVSRPAKGGP